MKEISILLPSLRPEASELSIREFETTNPNVDYEIVLVSPFQPVYSHRVKWIKEQNVLGSVIATQMAWENSIGEYVMYFSDDVSPMGNCLRNMLEFMKTKTNPFIGASKMMNQNRREIGPFGAYKRLYACYGCMSRETVKMLDGIFSRDFFYSWGDIDLSMKCWEQGGKVEICQDAIVIPRQIEDEVYKEHRSKYFQRDEEVFLSKWHDKLGKGYKRNEVNRRLC